MLLRVLHVGTTATKPHCDADPNVVCALGETKAFVCYADRTIWGTADTRLSNHQTEDRGYSKEKCQEECSSNAACTRLVFGPVDGYCELWAKVTVGEVKVTDGEDTSQLVDKRELCVRPGPSWLHCTSR